MWRKWSTRKCVENNEFCELGDCSATSCADKREISECSRTQRELRDNRAVCVAWNFNGWIPPPFATARRRLIYGRAALEMLLFVSVTKNRVCLSYSETLAQSHWYVNLSLCIWLPNCLFWFQFAAFNSRSEREVCLTFDFTAMSEV